MPITTDNGAHMAGYIEQYLASFDNCDLHISIKPGTDTDDTFEAFDHDEQEMIRINGWTCVLEPIEEC